MKHVDLPISRALLAAILRQYCREEEYLLGMSRSGFFAPESESESFDSEYLPISCPDLILL